MKSNSFGWNNCIEPQFLSMDPVLPPEGVPDPLLYKDGAWYLNLYAKEAHVVTYGWADQVFLCEKKEDGTWQSRLPFQNGMNYIAIQIDGVDVLNPYLPIGYGYSRPCNYIELPQEDGDFYATRKVKHGRVIIEKYFSKVTREWERCMVYTPYAYDEEPEKTFPVLYLQHGHGENEIGWISTGRLPDILDNLLAEGKCEPFVVVMNSGMVQVEMDGERTVDFTRFDDLLTVDIIPFIEGRYHAGGQRKLRGMAGLSMGSLQTSISGFKHPEMFSCLGIFSGFLHDWIQGSLIDMVDRGAGDDQHLEFLKKLKDSRVFDVFFRGIGEEDPFLEYFLGDDELVKASGIQETRVIYPGTHDWNTWRYCIRDFAQLIFREK